MNENIIQAIFEGSEFEIIKREHPPGLRRLSEIRNNKLDIFIGSSNKALEKLYPGILDAHNKPILNTTKSFYSVVESNHSRETLSNLDKYVVGSLSLPRKVYFAALGFDPGPTQPFPSNQSLLKALSEKRVDIIIGTTFITKRNIGLLNLQREIHQFSRGNPLYNYMLVRKSIPPKKKKRIFSILDTKIEEIKKTGLLLEILRKNGFDEFAIARP
ncbi:ABC transporter substrate-binding protein [Pseudomaricurvus alkylphenolicus]|uniref:ABC transporter substrate-binding protein n=1 Tax=Pseudomaricurvus alkylphenolicus TaxID=1306991 RepID=UPI00141FFAA2|nr:ABC transporter substrate-binding protein [Pseudomaricurvus alkylphenolicus]NIB44133.1 ABC transporter substrate-binding protein [Pseudomaricurvus alkylphenolicus]